MRLETAIALITMFAEEDGFAENAGDLTFSVRGFCEDEDYTYCLWQLCDIPAKKTVGKLRFNFIKGRLTSLLMGAGAGSAPSGSASGSIPGLGTAGQEALNGAYESYKAVKPAKGLHNKFGRELASSQAELQGVADWYAYDATAGTDQEGGTLLTMRSLFVVGGITRIVENLFDEDAGYATRYYPNDDGNYQAFSRRTSSIQLGFTPSRAQLLRGLEKIAKEAIFDHIEDGQVMSSRVFRHDINYDTGAVTSTS